MHALARRVARLEQRTAAQHPAPCGVRYLETTPKDQEAVLAILLEAGALRYGDDGTLLRLADGGGYVPWRPLATNWSSWRSGSCPTRIASAPIRRPRALMGR
jgi:hypothetical protein